MALHEPTPEQGAAVDSGPQTPGARLARLVTAELEELGSQLDRARRGKDRAVHRARKSLQRLRAMVQLFAPLDPALAARENLWLRRLRRRLGPLRDAAARAQTFQVLARRKRWKPHSEQLRRLGGEELVRHRAAWRQRPPQDPFWTAIAGQYRQLQQRISRWPLQELDADTIEQVLRRARRRLEKRVAAARGAHGRDLRHELRRKLRRYASLVRAAAASGVETGEPVDALLALAKRCGHEGDLWMAVRSVRAAARAQPELRALALALERARRDLCRRHDQQLARLLRDHSQ